MRINESCFDISMSGCRIRKGSTCIHIPRAEIATSLRCSRLRVSHCIVRIAGILTYQLQLCYLVADYFAGDHVDHIFGDVGCVVGNSFEVS